MWFTSCVSGTRIRSAGCPQVLLAGTTFTLLAKHIEEQVDGPPVVVKQMHHLLSARSDPAPGVYKRRLAEQCRLNGERVKPRV